MVASMSSSSTSYEVLPASPSLPELELCHDPWMSYTSSQVRIALEEKKKTYKSVYIVQLRAEQVLPGYVQYYDKTGSVPTLCHNGLPVTNPINQIIHLDDNFDTGTNLIPGKMREEVLEWLTVFDKAPIDEITFSTMLNKGKNSKAKLNGMKMSPTNIAASKLMVKTLTTKRKALVKQIQRQRGDLKMYYQRKLVEEDEFLYRLADESHNVRWQNYVEDMCDKLEDTMEAHGGTYALGNEWTAVDCAAAPALHRLAYLGFSGRMYKGESPAPRPRPHIRAYLDAVQSRPSFQRAVRGAHESLCSAVVYPVLGSLLGFHVKPPRGIPGQEPTGGDPKTGSSLSSIATVVGTLA